MYLLDKPMSTTDNKSFQNFSINLAKSISSTYKLLADEESSFVIALNGEWGSGKSTIINLMLNNLKKEDEIIIIKFNPWNFSTSEDLIKKFFIQLISHLNSCDKKNEKLMTTLEKYTKIITGVNSILNIELVEKLIRANENIIEQSQKVHYKEDSLEAVKIELNNALKDKKILIIIDDIDRLLPTQITQIFQLVKSVGDLKNIVYLLAFDKNVVCEYMKSIQIYNPDKYIEKIVQISLEIPTLSNSYISQHFNENLKNMGIEIMKPNQDGSFELLLPASREILLFHNAFKTIRSLKKYLNVLYFEYEPIKSKVNPDDFVVITYIKVFHFNLYNKIYQNKSKLTSMYAIKESNEFLFEILLKDEDNIYKPLLSKLLSYIFPPLITNYKYGSYDYSPQKIWNELYFDYYFNLFPFASSESIYHTILKQKTFDDLCIQLQYISLADRYNFLKFISINADNVTKEDIGNFLYLILSNATIMYSKYNISLSSTKIIELLKCVISEEKELHLFLTQIYQRIVDENKFLSNLTLLNTIDSSYSLYSIDPYIIDQVYNLFSNIYNISIKYLEDNFKFVLSPDFNALIQFMSHRVHEGRFLNFAILTYTQILYISVNKLHTDTELKTLKNIYSSIYSNIKSKTNLIADPKIRCLVQQLSTELN